MGKIEAICINEKRGNKFPVNLCVIVKNLGLHTDYHARKDSPRQISILTLDKFKEIQKELAEKNIDIRYGAFGENFIVSGLSMEEIKIGTKLHLDDNVILEVTIIGKNCPEPCIIYKTLGKCIMPDYGIFCKVINGGLVKVGDSINYDK